MATTMFAFLSLALSVLAHEQGGVRWSIRMIRRKRTILECDHGILAQVGDFWENLPIPEEFA